jgi:hypothetical protein
VRRSPPLSFFLYVSPLSLAASDGTITVEINKKVKKRKKAAATAALQSLTPARGNCTIVISTTVQR